MILFRPVEESDFPMLFDWLQLPHIKKWWDDGDDTLEKVINHYSSEGERIKRFIFLFCENETVTPAGYFQYCLEPGGLVGIDQFLANPETLNQGIGTQAVSAFLEVITSKHVVKAIFLDPEPSNKRAIRCYEKVGFQYQETINGENGKLAYIMRLEQNF